MLQLVVILTVAFIIAPLIELWESERKIAIAKAVVYILTLLWIIMTLFVHGKEAF